MTVMMLYSPSAESSLNVVERKKYKSHLRCPEVWSLQSFKVTEGARKSRETHSHATDSGALHDMTTCSSWTVVDDDVASSAMTLHNASWEAKARAWAADRERLPENRSGLGRTMGAAANTDVDTAAAASLGERHCILVDADAVVWCAGDAIDSSVRNAAAGARWNETMDKRAVDS